jgi:catechol 2,3-dioxygenase-like lactoylglutathione lyase family enzyme
MKPRIESVEIGADPQAWADAGFTLEATACRTGTVRIAIGAGRGITGWSLIDSPTAEFDGLPTRIAESPLAPSPPPPHPNGTVQIDHIVAFTPDLERTTAPFEEAGIERRRVREVENDGALLRQGFFRLGEVILEVVQHDKVEAGPARFWGITFTVTDLDAAADLAGEKLGSIRDAVQPGRRIATFRKDAGLGLPVALITPAPPRDSA